MKRVSVKHLSVWLITCVLAAFMLTAIHAATVTALAAEVARPTSTHSGSSTDTYATNTSAEESGEYYELQNPEEAAQVLRELMMRHARTATLHFYIDIPFEQENEEQDMIVDSRIQVVAEGNGEVVFADATRIEVRYERSEDEQIRQPQGGRLYLPRHKPLPLVGSNCLGR